MGLFRSGGVSLTTFPQLPIKFIGRKTLMSGGVLHKNHKPPHFRVIAKFCMEHISVTIKDINMKLYR